MKEFSFKNKYKSNKIFNFSTKALAGGEEFDEEWKVLTRSGNFSPLLVNQLRPGCLHLTNWFGGHQNLAIVVHFRIREVSWGLKLPFHTWQMTRYFGSTGNYRYLEKPQFATKGFRLVVSILISETKFL